MSGEHHLGAAATGIDLQRAQGGEEQRNLTFVFEHPLQSEHGPLALHAADRKRSPSSA